MDYDVFENRPLLGNNPSRRRYHPKGSTVDTLRRQGHPDKLDLRNFGTSLAITSNACQMARGSINPGVSHEIGVYWRLGEAGQTELAQQELIRSTTEMAIVHCKRLYINAGRGEKSPKYEKITAKAIAAQQTINEYCPWEDKAQQRCKQCMSLEWSRVRGSRGHKAGS